MNREQEILEHIKPLCEEFKIKYSYYNANNSEYIKLNNTNICITSNSLYAIKCEVVGYIFVMLFNDRDLGNFKTHVFNKIKQYWIKENE